MIIRVFRINKMYFWRVSFCLILFSFSMYIQCSPVYSQPCSSLVSLYQQTLDQFKKAQKIFLESGCVQLTDSPQCKRLGVGIQEMQGAIQMLGLRAKALKCNTLTNPLNEDPCQRLQKMQNKAESNLNELNRQQKLQRCDHRKFTPPCKSLAKAKKQPLGIIRAVIKKRKAKGCTSLKKKR